MAATDSPKVSVSRSLQSQLTLWMAVGPACKFDASSLFWNANAAAKTLGEAGFNTSTAVVDVSSRASVHALAVQAQGKRLLQ